MSLLKLEQMSELEDIEIDKIFNKCELIIYVNKDPNADEIRMDTLERERNDIMRLRYYQVMHNCEAVIGINYLGYSHIFPFEEQFKQFNKRLRRHNL